MATVKFGMVVDQHKADKPLSPEAAAARYNKQLRQGLYHKPGAPIVGVPLKSSDAAAVLAVKSNLLPNPSRQERTSIVAGTAASLANVSNLSPQIWKPADSSAYAASAALKSKERSIGSSKPAKEKDAYERNNRRRSASLAAASAHEASARDMAAGALPDAYAWAERKGPSDLGRSASLYTYKKRSSVISQQSDAGDGYPARRKSYSSGSSAHYNISNLEEQARKNAERRLSHIVLPSEVNAACQSQTSLHSGAAAQALATSREENARAPQERRAILQAVIEQHEVLMNAARSNARDRLDSIDRSISERDIFFNDDELNAQALAAAERNSKERMANHGKVDIGGGVYMSQLDIDQIAQRNVRPVLNEIDEKVDIQRQADDEKHAAEEEEHQRRLDEKRLEKERKAEDKRIVLEEKARQRAIQDKAKGDKKKQKAKAKAEKRQGRPEPVASGVPVGTVASGVLVGTAAPDVVGTAASVVVVDTEDHAAETSVPDGGVQASDIEAYTSIQSNQLTVVDEQLNTVNDNAEVHASPSQTTSQQPATDGSEVKESLVRGPIGIWMKGKLSKAKGVETKEEPRPRKVLAIPFSVRKDRPSRKTAPVISGPIMIEHKAEEPMPEEPMPEEPMPEEPMPEEPMPEEPMPEEPRLKEPKLEKPMPEEPMPEEVMSEQRLSEESAEVHEGYTEPGEPSVSSEKEAVAEADMVESDKEETLPETMNGAIDKDTVVEHNDYKQEFTEDGYKVPSMVTKADKGRVEGVFTEQF